jgi:hypothetical protein
MHDLNTDRYGTGPYRGVVLDAIVERLQQCSVWFVGDPEVMARPALSSGWPVIRTEFGDRSQWRDDPGIRGGHRLLQSQWHPVMMTVSFWTSVPISSSWVIPSQVD